MRLGQPTGTEFAARHLAFGRFDHSDAVSLQLRNVALGRGVLPHPDVHRGRDNHRLVGSEQQGRRKIVRHSRRHFGEQVGRRRTDQDEVGGAAELDMADLNLVLQLP